MNTAAICVVCRGAYSADMCVSWGGHPERHYRGLGNIDFELALVRSLSHRTIRSNESLAGWPSLG